MFLVAKLWKRGDNLVKSLERTDFAHRRGCARNAYGGTELARFWERG